MRRRFCLAGAAGVCALPFGLPAWGQSIVRIGLLSPTSMQANQSG